VAFDLRERRNHNFPEVSLVLGVEGDDCRFVGPYYCLARSDHALVCLRVQLIG
jgi:hypothetical protein